MRHSCDVSGAASSFLLSTFFVQYRVDLLLTLLRPSSKAQLQFINCWDYFIIGFVDIFFMTMNLRFVDLKIDTENITSFSQITHMEESEPGFKQVIYLPI